MNFSPYALYIKALAVILVLSCAFGAGHHMAAKAAHAEMTTHLLADSRAQAQAEKAARDAAAKTDETLAKAQKKVPHTGQKVSEAVNEHPTSPDCVAPDAAIDSLQDGIHSGEAAATR